MSINEQIAWYDETLKLLITIEGAAPNVAYTRGDLQRRKTIITKRRVTNVRKASGPVYIGARFFSKRKTMCVTLQGVTLVSLFRRRLIGDLCDAWNVSVVRFLN